MRVEGVTYRARQFWNALSGVPAPEDLEMARTILNPDQMALFKRMQASEQAHSLAVMQRLNAQSFQKERSFTLHRRDLLAAALLHDIGKSLFPLKIWDRVLVVLGEWFFPSRAEHWGSGSPAGWRQAFVVAQQHPEWGAKLAMQASSSPLTVELIRRHQTHPDKEPITIIDRLLRELQAADRNL